VAIEAPTSIIVAEFLDRGVDGIEFRITVVPGNNNSPIPKSDDIASSDASYIGQIPDVLINAPTPDLVGEIPQDKFNRLEAVVAVVEGDRDAVIPKTNDVAMSVASYISNKTDVFVNPPPACIVTKFFDCCEGLNTGAVTEDDDSIDTKTNDICEARACGGN
jgi:hypothetical protein